MKFDKCQSRRAIQLSGMAKFKILTFSGSADFSLLVWAAKPRRRRNIRWPNGPSHLAKRMMLDSSTHGQGGGGAIINTFNHVSPFQ
jgi:hypothetical protein